MDLIRLALPVPAGLTAWLAICLAVGLTAFGAWQANGFVVKEVEVSLPGLEKEVILVHIPDVHIGHHRGRAYLERIVEAANQAKPEMVLINGDLIDNNRAMEPGVLDPLKDLKAPAFLTTGNHEHYVDMDRALKIIAGLGVRILHNEVVQTNGLQLIGLDYMNADENSFDMHAVNRLTIKQELPKIPLAQDKPVVLMHHSPVGLDYVVKAGVDLMVSGHTHAGQVLPATWITPYIFPLNKGLYEQGKTRFFVSQGAGTYGPRLRLGSRNEINVIRLVPQK